MEKEERTSLTDIEELVDQYGYVHGVSRARQPRCGGQGCVFFTNDEHFAGKICFAPGGAQTPSQDTAANAAFERLRLLPIPQEAHVTLPLATLADYHGYIMRLLDGMVSFEDALAQDADTQEAPMPVADAMPEPYRTRLCASVAAGGFRRSLLAYAKAACSLAMLHARGLVYCDFSERNAFLSQDTADSNMQLIDADNLDYEEHLEASPRIIYTPGLGAPELVRQDGGCSFWSDSYAFAQALFRRLYLQHPFQGERYEEIAEEEDLGDEAEWACAAGDLAWILDEEDDSNADAAPLAPPFLLPRGLRRLFQATFSEASRMGDVCVRPTMMEWAEALLYALDNTVRAACGLDYIADGALGEAAISPWDDAPTHILRITSWRQTKTGRSRVWQFTHELVDGLAVPQRIVTGGVCRDADGRTAFTLRHMDGQWVLQAAAVFRVLEGGADEAHLASGARFYLEGTHLVVHLAAGIYQNIFMEVAWS